MTGCNVINGTITQALDIQNTTIQICNYNNRHFKLVEEVGTCPTIGFGKITDPKTGIAYHFPIACDIPSTCEPKDAWWDYAIGHSEKLSVTVNGISYSIMTFYGNNMCPSQSYDPQGKKLTIITNAVWENQTIVSAIIPKVLVENVTSVKVNNQNVIPFVTNYPTYNAIPECSESCYKVSIPLAYSTVSTKIEIGVESIPEFPLAEVVLTISIISGLLFYRIRF
jgi:hypothetical protein